MKVQVPVEDERSQLDIVMSVSPMMMRPSGFGMRIARRIRDAKTTAMVVSVAPERAPGNSAARAL